MEKTSSLKSKPQSIALISLGVMMPCMWGAISQDALAQMASAAVKHAQNSTTLPKLKDRGAPTGRQRGGASQNNSSGALPKLKDRGAPTGRRRGGASRNDCPTVSKPLTALVPGVEDGTPGASQRSISYLAATVVPYPTFWVYIPAFAGEARTGEFVLQNKAGDDLYRTALALPAGSGSIGINLPQQTQYALQLDQEYHWYFQLYCGDPETESEYFYVDAWVKRVSAASAPSAVTPSANAGTTDIPDGPQEVFWYDTLTESAPLQGDAWSTLLQEAGLSDIADEPILQQYPPQ